MRDHGSRPGRSDVRVSVGVGVVALAGLLLLPLLARLEPEAGVGAPVLGEVAWWASLGTVAAQSIVLAWRRLLPEVVAVSVAGAVLVGAAAGMGSTIGLTSLALLVAVYTLASLRAPSQVWSVLGVVWLLVATGHAVAGLRTDVRADEAVVTGVVQAVGLLGASLAVAAVVAARRESRSAREDRVEALEREHLALMQAAVAQERTAMARELHDIAAHHLTGIAVMSAAIATQIDTDPAGAKEAVKAVRHESTAVLRDLRSLVGLLRDGDGTAGHEGVRVETLAGVPGLVGEVSAAGQDVALTVIAATDGRPLGSAVGPLAQLAAYRTVQESLANAARHAPGAPCEVEVDDRDPEALVVTVRNAAARRVPGPEARGGLGLVGMRERAELTGSHLDIGPTDGGGWQVRLRTPRAVEEPT